MLIDTLRSRGPRVCTRASLTALFLFACVLAVGVRADAQRAPHFGRTLAELNNAPGDGISDHHPITADLPSDEPPPTARTEANRLSE